MAAMLGGAMATTLGTTTWTWRRCGEDAGAGSSAENFCAGGLTALHFLLETPRPWELRFACSEGRGIRQTTYPDPMTQYGLYFFLRNQFVSKESVLIWSGMLSMGLRLWRGSAWLHVSGFLFVWVICFHFEKRPQRVGRIMFANFTILRVRGLQQLSSFPLL